MYKAVKARLRVLLHKARAGTRRDAGMVTSEYAVGVVAAVAFATVLYKLATSEAVSAQLQALMNRALGAAV
ncbi:DUF4244 domain-containing protein [Streptomyces sp. NPDC049915]|uniref:DUF4244 domain-containing protein n=1 Tax=Streptomyces sp. NPDC049915 TaxID=3155510 RepID=UPI00341344A7